MFQGYRSKSGIAIFAYYAYSLFNLVVLDQLKKLKPFYHIIRIKGELFTSDGFKYFDRSLHNFFKNCVQLQSSNFIFPLYERVREENLSTPSPPPLSCCVSVLSLLFVYFLFIYLPSILFQSTRLRVSRSASSIHTYTTTCRQFTGVLGVERTLQTVYWSTTRSRQNLVDSLVEYLEQIVPCREFSGILGVDITFQTVQWSAESRQFTGVLGVDRTLQTVQWSTRSRQFLV